MWTLEDETPEADLAPASLDQPVAPPAQDQPTQQAPGKTHSEYLDADLLAALDAALGTSYASAIRGRPKPNARRPNTSSRLPTPPSSIPPASTRASRPRPAPSLADAVESAPAVESHPPAPVAPVAVAPVVPVPAPMPPLVPQPIAELAPLSAPLDAHGDGEDEHAAPGSGQGQVRVRADLLDQLVNHAGEVAIYRARLEQQMGAFHLCPAMAEAGPHQHSPARPAASPRIWRPRRRSSPATSASRAPAMPRSSAELDRFSTLQQLSRALAESAADISGLQGVLVDLARQNDSLLGQQSRVSSELQDGLMRARMVPFPKAACRACAGYCARPRRRPASRPSCSSKARTANWTATCSSA